VFPYTTEDLVGAERLLEAGCRVLMPWGAPIGSGLGLNNLYGLRSLRAHFPEVPLVIDAGLGLPSHAAAAMELGYDGVLLNTAVAKAGDPVQMAAAFSQAVAAGRLAFEADPMEPRDMAAPSTPLIGKAFLA
jgi:thiazole synthase